MSNYFSPQMNARGPAPWISEVKGQPFRAPNRFGAVRSGTTRNLTRGWTGDREISGRTLNTLTQGLFAVGAAQRRGGKQQRGATPGTPVPNVPSLGAPNTAAATATSPLALGPGARPMPQSQHRLALGAGPAEGPAKPSIHQQVWDQVGAELPSLQAGPRVFPMGPGKVPQDPWVEGFVAREQQARAGSARSAAPRTGKMSQMPDPGNQDAPSVRPGRQNTRRQSGGGLGPQGKSLWQ